MQTKRILGGTLVLTMAILMLTAATQQQKEKKDKGQKQERQIENGNSENENEQDDRQGKNKKNNNDRKDNEQEENGNKGNNKYKEKKNNNGNRDNENEQGEDRDNKNGKLKYDKNVFYGYNWDDQDFKDRKRFKSQNKVTVCHKINRNGEGGVTIRVSENALKAHMNHGDAQGECATSNNTGVSNSFLRNRTDYYNNLQNTQEEIYYSRSVLDYALLRLTNGRTQLQQMQSNNVPAAELQRKQEAVTALEQNTTLLQTLLGVAVEVVANKLQ